MQIFHETIFVFDVPCGHPKSSNLCWNILKYIPLPSLKTNPQIPQKWVAPFYSQKNMYRWNTLIITSRIICRWTTIKSIMGWATWAATDTSRVRWGFARRIWVWKVTKRSNIFSKIFKSYIITLSCMLWQSPLSFKKPLTSCRNALCCCQPFWALESISFEKLQQPNPFANCSRSKVRRFQSSYQTFETALISWLYDFDLEYFEIKRYYTKFFVVLEIHLIRN